MIGVLRMVLLMLAAALLAVLSKAVVRHWPNGYVVLLVCLLSLPIFVCALGALGFYMDIGRPATATLRYVGVGMSYGIFAWVYVTVSGVRAWRHSRIDRPVAG